MGRGAWIQHFPLTNIKIITNYIGSRSSKTASHPSTSQGQKLLECIVRLGSGITIMERPRLSEFDSTGRRAFSLSINRWQILNQVPRGGAMLTYFPKIGLAVKLEGKQAS